MKTKPKVLFILHLPPPVHGAAMMGKYIHDSQLVNDSFDCHFINLTTATSLEDIGKGGIKKAFRFLELLRKIRKEVKRLKPDLVYVTPNAAAPAFYKDFIVVQMLKCMGCKVVAHYHNKGVQRRQNRWLDDKLYRRFFKNLKVILLAEALYKDVEKYVRWEDVLICPNGIPETLTAEPKAKRNNEIPHLLFLSNLLESKGVLVLLDACKILMEKGYSFVCDFVGGETAEIDAARFVKEVETRGLNRMVFYQGRKYGDEKHKAFEKADLFVFPSTNDCFPLVNLEAMEHKLPIVTTDEGGIPDVVKDGENGIIVNRKDVESLQSAIATLLNSEDLRHKMGEDGYAKFKKNFTLKAFEQQFVDTIDNCEWGGVIPFSWVYFYGKRYGQDKELFWQTADIFVFPTAYPQECFPLVLLEAMQHSVAVVSTNEGGIPAIIKNGENGYMVEKNNPQALADKLSDMLTHMESTRQMGKRGYQKYQRSFTIQAFEQKFVDCLSSVV